MVCAQFTTGTAFVIDGVLVNEISISPDFPEELSSFSSVSLFNLKF